MNTEPLCHYSNRSYYRSPLLSRVYYESSEVKKSVRIYHAPRTGRQVVGLSKAMSASHLTALRSAVIETRSIKIQSKGESKMINHDIRVLITGSRSWIDSDSIESVLSEINEYSMGIDKVTLVSGHCPNGVDMLAENIAKKFCWDLELHPADWNKYGKSAGFKRNQEMVDLGANVVLAFIRNESNGASHTANAAINAGLYTRIFRTESTEFPYVIDEKEYNVIGGKY